MRNWLVGRHNEVYRIVNAHNWPFGKIQQMHTGTEV